MTIRERRSIEVDGLEFEVLRSLLRQGLYTQKKHDEIVPEIVTDLAKDFGVDLDEADRRFTDALTKFRGIAGEGDW